jgi:hypothetical protein
MHVGSQVWATSSHSLTPFGQLLIVLRSILVNPEWRRDLKSEILNFLWPLSVNFGLFRGEFWSNLNSGEARKVKFSISKYKTIFGYPFERCTWGHDGGRCQAIFGPLLVNIEYSKSVFDQPQMVAMPEK